LLLIALFGVRVLGSAFDSSGFAFGFGVVALEFAPVLGAAVLEFALVLGDAVLEFAEAVLDVVFLTPVVFDAVLPFFSAITPLPWVDGAVRWY